MFIIPAGDCSAAYEEYRKACQDLPVSDRTLACSRFEEAVACYHMRDVWRAQQLFQRCAAIAPNDQATKVYLARCEQPPNAGHAEAGGRFSGRPDRAAARPRNRAIVRRIPNGG